jgi:hypothetical protein
VDHVSGCTFNKDRSSSFRLCRWTYRAALTARAGHRSTSIFNLRRQGNLMDTHGRFCINAFRFRPTLCALFGFWVFLLSALSALGQVAGGSISGTVTDPSRESSREPKLWRETPLKA